MFDFAWSEIALIAVVAMIAIGPKDMPVAIRAVTGWIKKARRMAAEFQTHVDEMVREADLERGAHLDQRDPQLRHPGRDREDGRPGRLDPLSTFASDPLAPATPRARPRWRRSRSPNRWSTEIAPPAAKPIASPRRRAAPRAPAFVPPNLVLPLPPADCGRGREPPAFIPPDVARQRRAHPSA